MVSQSRGGAAAGTQVRGRLVREQLEGVGSPSPPRRRGVKDGTEEGARHPLRRGKGVVVSRHSGIAGSGAVA